MRESCKRYLIAGRVQGVWFRQSTLEQARRLGLRGWVRNLPDGRVEVVAAGPGERLRRLHDWLWRGPELARVDGVDERPADGEPLPELFEVR